MYDFEAASPGTCRELLDLYEREAWHLLGQYGMTQPLGNALSGEGRPGTTAASSWTAQPQRFPLRKAYELCLKCSHLFNILDARGAISVTERVALIARIRKMAVRVAAIYSDRLRPAPAAAEAVLA